MSAAGLVKIADFAPLPEGDRQYTVEFCEANRALVLSDEGEHVVVGFSGEAEPSLLDALAKHHRKPVKPEALDAEDFSAYLARRLSREGGGDAARESDSEWAFALDKLANDAPIIAFVNSVCIEAIRAQASDIHIEAFDSEAMVRYRVDGRLYIAQRFSRDRFAAVSTRIKVMANLNILERRLPQDGRITVDLGGVGVDMRVSIVPIVRGESIVLRLFGRSSEPLALSELGMASDVAERVRAMLKIPHGLVLVTGPTGSGKSTTLNAMVRELRDPSIKIVAIEDPVEYIVDGVDQIQTNEQIKLGFDTILRRVLRQDPDVIMVGEIRDHLTADLVVRAAMTGHLVISTLHTNDSIAAIPRLRNIGLESYLIASVLRGAMAQRLVRRVCPACSSARSPSRAESALFERWCIQVESVPAPMGCPACRGTGYSGRIALFEFFDTDEALEDLISRGERSAKLHEHLANRGFRRLASAALDAVAAGRTSIEEIEREVEL